MKKILLVSVFFVLGTFIYAQVETVAKEVLNAYKDRNVENLKEHASGIMLMAISDSYFEDKGLQEDIRAAENWDGKFREIRYYSGDMMGKTIYIAAVYFADVQDNEDKIYTVVLSSQDKEKWLMFGAGLVAETKEEFNKMSLEIPSGEERGEEREEEREEDTKVIKNFSLEVFDGPSYDKATQEILEESFSTLNADNFFISLANNDNWIQVAYSDNGYSVDYNNANGHYMVKGYLEKEEALQLLINYLNQTEDWNKNHSWVDFEY